MVVHLFDAVAAGYDEPRRRLVPCFDDFYGTAVAATAAVLREVAAPRVLDLGAGTGLLAGLVARAVPGTDLTLVDAAPAMLAVAERRLTGVAHRVHVADLIDPLPGGGYHAIVSALAIHHLDDPAKRDLYRRVAAALAPGGIFVNADQVAGPTPELDRRYDAEWLVAIRALGSDDAEIAAARERMAYDRPAPVEAQCDWLRTCGFVDVDCFYKSWRFAVFGGRV
jgi:tRNA (cmo5U34)-methyltransferase